MRGNPIATRRSSSVRKGEFATAVSRVARRIWPRAATTTPQTQSTTPFTAAMRMPARTRIAPPSGPRLRDPSAMAAAITTPTILIPPPSATRAVPTRYASRYLSTTAGPDDEAADSRRSPWPEPGRPPSLRAGEPDSWAGSDGARACSVASAHSPMSLSLVQHLPQVVAPEFTAPPHFGQCRPLPVDSFPVT